MRRPLGRDRTSMLAVYSGHRDGRSCRRGPALDVIANLPHPGKAVFASAADRGREGSCASKFTRIDALVSPTNGFGQRALKGAA